jgi:hypothetical protein
MGARGNIRKIYPLRKVARGGIQDARLLINCLLCFGRGLFVWVSAVMKVTSIDITDLHYVTARAHHLGHVTLQLLAVQDSAPMLVHFVCQSSHPCDSPVSLVIHDLVADALRQAQRMPGFRRGEREIELTGVRPRVTPRTVTA